MILRLRTSDISPFSGYAHGDNKELDNYLDLFNHSEEMQYFQLEGRYNDVDMGLITYLAHKLPDCKMFPKVDIPDDGNMKCATYTICFARQEA